MKKQLPSEMNNYSETGTRNGQDIVNEKLSQSLSLTSRILFSVYENNEYGALMAAEEQIQKGMVGFLGDELEEWKFYLVKLLTMMTYMICKQEEPASYLEKRIQNRLKQVHSCKTTQECEAVLKEMVTAGYNLQQEIGGNYSILVRRVMEHVATDLTKPLTLHYFAELLNVNSSYLSNLFRRQTGMTLTEYVTQKRISHAVTLLSYTNLPVKQIAKMSGVPDVQYFSRLFKRKMDMTPTEYRDLKKGEPKIDQPEQMF